MANRNGNTSEPNGATTAALGRFKVFASLQQPYGTFLVEEGAAQDHAIMRADQLASLLLLMRVNDAGFRNVGGGAQLSLLWLATQLADELRDMLPIVAKEVR